jgi:hypothetical protein
MHAINRPHVPDEATADFIFKAYMLLLKNAPPTFDKWARQGAFENIAACAESWRVVGISENPLRQTVRFEPSPAEGEEAFKADTMLARCGPKAVTKDAYELIGTSTSVDLGTHDNGWA